MTRPPDQGTGTIRTVLVDDEAPSRERLRTLLAARPDIALVGEAVDGSSAVERLSTLLPDLLLLDVQMPGLDGFEVLGALGDQAPPAVIFVTAYDEYAIRAFDAHAADYLLKPIRPERLAQALDRAGERLAARPSRSGGMPALVRDWIAKHQPRRFAARIGDRIKLIGDERVLWIEGAGNYARLHTADERLPVRIALRDLEATLDPNRFLRIHRSTIVNVDAVETLLAEGDGEYTLQLTNGTALRSSRRYGDRIRALLRPRRAPGS